MPLSHPPFSASTTLQAVQKGNATLRRSQKTAAVRLLQAALIQLGHALPGSLDKSGVPDGSFGMETETAVKAFQTQADAT